MQRYYSVLINAPQTLIMMWSYMCTRDSYNSQKVSGSLMTLSRLFGVHVHVLACMLVNLVLQEPYNIVPYGVAVVPI